MKKKKSIKLLIISFLIILDIISISFYFFYDFQNNFSITFLDVGQGNATLIQTEHHLKLLIDSGKGLEAKTAFSKEINFFDHAVDICIATHFDLDHVGIFPYISSRFDVSYFFDNGINNKKDIFKLIDKNLSENKVTRKKIVAGDILQIDEDTKIEILFPFNSLDIDSFKDNTSSLIMKIFYKDNSILITGDSPAKIEKFLVKYYGEKLKSDILVAGHHGSKTSSSEIFLKTVQPEYIIFSAGKNNSYHHPNKEILERVENLGIKILRTDEIGNIKFIYQGNKFVLQD